MVCIYCSEETHVINSRPQRRLNQIWRRRKCLICKSVFTTEENARYEAAWLVRKNTGRLEPFSRDKLLISLYKSCEHRPTALSDAGGLCETVIKKLLTQVENGVINHGALIRTVQVALNRFDKAASVHYAAFHKLA